MQRTLTGIVFVALIVAAILVHPCLFAVVFGLISGMLILELYQLTKYDGALWLRSLGVFAGAYLFAATALYAGDYAGAIIYVPYILMLVVMLVSGLYAKSSDIVAQWGLLFFAQAYCAAGFSLLCFIPYLADGGYNPVPVLLIFVFIWLNDTGAYLTGSRFGRHRLFLRISPSKSWEGCYGGLAVVIAASLLIPRYFNTGMDLAWYEWLAFAVVTVIAATLGDLIESLIKRTC
ncbi:MAG: phosphatidate cytidylyltransferase, partial [Tannerella sp.]|nr:phosphatidate cytidylyltransferase [Tannerella sp.]